MSLVLDHFIEPLLAVKPEVQHEEPRRFLATLPELFEGETVEVYTEAVRQARFMARGHKFPSEDVLRKGSSKRDGSSTRQTARRKAPPARLITNRSPTSTHGLRNGRGDR